MPKQDNGQQEDSRCFEEADPCQSQDHDKSQPLCLDNLRLQVWLQSYSLSTTADSSLGCPLVASSSTAQCWGTVPSHVLLLRGAMLWTAPAQRALQQLLLVPRVLLVQPVQLPTRPCVAIESPEKSWHPFLRSRGTRESTRAESGGRLA